MEMALLTSHRFARSWRDGSPTSAAHPAATAAALSSLAPVRLYQKEP